MKAINEMILEELQDYALELQNTLATKNEELQAKDNHITELQDLNKTLQQRNNALFRQVEQQVPGTPGPTTEEQVIPTCEELAKTNYKEFIK